MAHRTTIWRRKQRQDFTLDSELLRLKRPKEPKDWRRVTLLDGRKRYIPKAKLFFIGLPGRREKSEARRQKALNQVATLIANKRQKNNEEESGLFNWKKEFRFCQRNLALWNCPHDKIVVAAHDGLHIGGRRVEGVKRGMVHYWRNHLDFKFAVWSIQGLAFSKDSYRRMTYRRLLRDFKKRAHGD